MRFATTLPDITELLALCASVGWTTYEDEPAVLERAVRQSHSVACACPETGELQGFVRTVSDDVSVTLVQTLVVHPEAQQGDIGRAVMERVMARYTHVRHQLLITKATSRQPGFYTSLGWHNTRDLTWDVTNGFHHDPFRELS